MQSPSPAKKHKSPSKRQTSPKHCTKEANQKKTSKDSKKKEKKDGMKNHITADTRTPSVGGHVPHVIKSIVVDLKHQDGPVKPLSAVPNRLKRKSIGFVPVCCFLSF